MKEGKGCRECGIIKRAKTQSKPIDEFISQANEVHDFKYDYSKAVYNGARRNLIIICKIHGEFNQTPDNHLGGSGCLKCGKIETANNGDTVVALINNEATLKRYYLSDKGVELHPQNQDFNIIHVSPDDHFRINGIVLAVFREYGRN